MEDQLSVYVLKAVVFITGFLVLLSIIFAIWFINRVLIGNTIKIKYKGVEYKCTQPSGLSTIHVFCNGRKIGERFFYSGIKTFEKDIKEYCLIAIKDSLENQESLKYSKQNVNRILNNN